ncbi:MAG: hypothetical protein MZV64_61095 [Ignavibacteriales bacterium]|nr:hypothetical protein [Ignavibacteriales bacterium]
MIVWLFLNSPQQTPQNGKAADSTIVASEQTKEKSKDKSQTQNLENEAGDTQAAFRQFEIWHFFPGFEGRRKNH